MRVFVKKRLKEFWVKYTDSQEQLKSWYKEVSSAEWKTPNDIKTDYPTASILKSGRVVFNICGNKYRLIVQVNYERQWMFIRYLGSHKDYDSIDAETV